MIGKCFALFCSISVIYSAFTGRLSDLSDAILKGADRSVELSVSLLGIMCLWGGVMALLRHSGAIERLARILRPILRFAFPAAFSKNAGAEEITANISANLFGIGNAATPLAISAMKRMQEYNPYPDEASDDMITLAVLNSSSFNLFPTTIIALRRSASSASPYSVIVPIWITSAVCSVLAVVICRLFAAADKKRRRKSQ